MKVGILTFHNAINYGAVLQCYALKEFLVQRGHKVEVIDYRNQYVEDYARLIPIKPLAEERGLVRKIKFVVKSLKLYSQKQAIKRVFDAFISYHFNLSKRVKSPGNVSSRYDIIIFGSDQIWNPHLCGGFDQAFYGQFPQNGSKFVAYAASLGNPAVLNDAEWKEVGKRLGVFDRISVREVELKDVLNDKFNISACQCVDPTLLVKPQILTAIAKEPIEDNYVFLFDVMRDDEAESFASYIAQKLNCKVIIGQSKPRWTNLRINDNNILVKCASPEEFLGYIKKARVVMGNSFHVVALSIAFRKDFYSLDSRKPERIKSLLLQLGLIYRHVKSSDRIAKLTKINYNEVEVKMNKICDSSIKFLIGTGI